MDLKPVLPEVRQGEQEQVSDTVPLVAGSTRGSRRIVRLPGEEQPYRLLVGADNPTLLSSGAARERRTVAQSIEENPVSQTAETQKKDHETSHAAAEASLLEPDQAVNLNKQAFFNKAHRNCSKNLGKTIVHITIDSLLYELA